jgi:hypothetical protein
MPVNFKNRKILWLASVAAIALLTSYCPAATISNLFNTGVDPAGNPLLGTGTADPHYALISSPAAYTAVTVNDPGYPISPNGPWAANSPTSRWIGPDGTSNGAGGNYIYRTTFTVPANAILSSVNVFGLWAVDDVATDILINGNSTAPPSPFYTPLAPFAVTSGFVFGINTLDFAITNANIGINPTGLRVDRIVGTYQVPEPRTRGFAIAGLIYTIAFATYRRIHQTEVTRMT